MGGGFNTEIEHEGRTFHIQTEDKGLSSAWLESVIYVGGQVVARKRSSYKHLLDQGEGTAAIADFMNHQHRLMIREIQRGRFDVAAAELAPLAEPRRKEAGSTLDEEVLDYLRQEAEDEQLALTMQTVGDLAQGVSTTLLLRAATSPGEQPVEGARVTVKLISTIDKPKTLAQGVTDETGVLRLGVEVPRLQEGVAALIISAVSSVGRAELKHLL